MELTRQTPAGRELIQSYAGGTFRVSDTVHRGAVIVTPKATFSWNVARFEDITLESFAPLLSGDIKVDVCLLGCGARMQRLPLDVRTALKEKGLIVEPMDTGAACRTYNMLIAENRMVAAALIAV
ncbi:MAG: Mth938-like domain-containing protein [Rhodospirillaceae bacterium]|nr:Mth938-like domain-containing protein [Rhodospirillaceae bacterium]